MATKLTPPQVKALQYFSACADGVGVVRRRELGLKWPTKVVVDRLIEKGLLRYVNGSRFDYLLKCDVPHNVVRISPAGEAVLGEDKAF